jgi:hypothetical protein
VTFPTPVPRIGQRGQSLWQSRQCVVLTRGRFDQAELVGTCWRARARATMRRRWASMVTAPGSAAARIRLSAHRSSSSAGRLERSPAPTGASLCTRRVGRRPSRRCDLRLRSITLLARLRLGLFEQILWGGPEALGRRLLRV